MKNPRLLARRARLTALVFILPMLIAVGLRAGEIHDAAAAGDLNKVRSFLEAAPTLLESQDSNGLTPLHKACFAKQGAVARFLLDQGASVTVRDKFQQTPLHRACYASGHDLALVQAIINKGADVNAHGINGITPLHWAAFKGDVELAKLLFANGSDVNAYENYSGPTTTSSISGTVLQVAIDQGPSEELAMLLVERGAKLGRKDSSGNTELHLAALKGRADLARLLVNRGADANAVNVYNRTALCYAAKHGYRRTANALIAAGAKESGIGETNYGNAPQLTAALEEGEAYLWYLGGGYAVKTKGHLLLFNPPEIDESPEAGLANGHINPNELAGLNITVLATLSERFQYGPEAFKLARRMPGIELVFGVKPPASRADDRDDPTYRLATANGSFAGDGIQVHAIPATGGGMGFLVEADGVKVFHAGFHVSDNKAANLARYRKEIDFLAPRGPIDIAIVSVNSHSNSIEAAYEPFLYLLNRLSPKTVYLTGANLPEQYPQCAEVLRVDRTSVAYPEGGRAKGERFHFVREQTSATTPATDSRFSLETISASR